MSCLCHACLLMSGTHIVACGCGAVLRSPAAALHPIPRFLKPPLSLVQACSSAVIERSLIRAECTKSRIKKKKMYKAIASCSRYRVPMPLHTLSQISLAVPTLLRLCLRSLLLLSSCATQKTGRVLRFLCCKAVSLNSDRNN